MEEERYYMFSYKNKINAYDVAPSGDHHYNEEFDVEIGKELFRWYETNERRSYIWAFFYSDHKDTLNGAINLLKTGGCTDGIVEIKIIEKPPEIFTINNPYTIAYKIACIKQFTIQEFIDKYST